MCVRWRLEGGGDGGGSVVKDEIERARSSERNSLEEGIRGMDEEYERTGAPRRNDVRINYLRR